MMIPITGITPTHEIRYMRTREQSGVKAEYEQRLSDFRFYTEILGTAYSTVFFGGPFAQLKFLRHIRRFNTTKFIKTFGGYTFPGSSLGIMGLSMIYDHVRESPRQDTLTSTSGVRVPKTRGGTKSSRAAGAAQTLKPFWSNGKPKCRKGYRYDFKRKMCVKKS
ncbi:MAG: hypothetical protein [Circular genetic element sp.]|nr:MAG: hypothetical protein [Circular genetic element sp.]